MRFLDQGSLLPIQSCCENRGPVFLPEVNIYNERNAFRIQDTACWPMRVVKSGQIEQWLLKQKAQFSGEKDNGSLKDKMLMPKQADLDSRIKVSSWCTSHFMTRPPLASPSLFFPTFTRLLKSCGMWAGWRESGQVWQAPSQSFPPP